MRAIRFHQFGGPEVLRHEDVAEPAVGDEQVLIKVAAAGVNYSDLGRRQGHYPSAFPLPLTPGLEVAGHVVQVGAEVSTLRVGERVMAWVGGGGYAEYATAAPDAVYPLPDSLSAQTAAGMPVVFATAYHILKTSARVQPQDFVLVQAAASGVGTIAVQLAKLWGARVFATASSEHKLQRLRQLGVQEVINYTEHDFVSEVLRMTDRRGVDVVLECIGGDVLTRSLDCLVPLGRLVVYGRASGSLPLLDAAQILTRNLTVSGLHLGLPPWHAALHRQPIQELLAMVQAGTLRPVLDRTFPLAQAADAHRYLAARRVVGKVVLIP